MHQIMAATLEPGHSQVACYQLRLLLQPSIRGTMVKVARSLEAGVVGLMLPQGV